MYGNDMRQLCTEKTQSWRGAHEVRLEISGRDRFRARDDVVPVVVGDS